MLEEEEESTRAAEEISIDVPPVAQPIISRNSSTFVGVPEDSGLEDLAYLSFRAALDIGFNLDPTISIKQNKKRVHEWR